MVWCTEDRVPRGSVPRTDGRACAREASRELAGLADGVHVFRVVTTDMAGKTAVDADAYQ